MCVCVDTEREEGRKRVRGTSCFNLRPRHRISHYTIPICRWHEIKLYLILRASLVNCYGVEKPIKHLFMRVGNEWRCQWFNSIEQGIWKWTGGWENSNDRPQRDYARNALSNRKKYFQKRYTKLDQFTN